MKIFAKSYVSRALSWTKNSGKKWTCRLSNQLSMEDIDSYSSGLRFISMDSNKGSKTYGESFWQK